MPSRLAIVSTAAVLSLLAAAPVLAGLGMGAPGKWDNLQVGLTYRLYHPTKTVGFKLRKLRTAPCGKGHDAWVEAFYGKYNGTLRSKRKGFALYEGHPICANPAESTRVGRPKIMGVKAYLGVYCGVPKKCRASQGVKNGFTLQWKARRSKPYKKNTWMQLDTSHLTKAKLLKIAKGLKKVR